MLHFYFCSFTTWVVLKKVSYWYEEQTAHAELLLSTDWGDTCKSGYWLYMVPYAGEEASALAFAELPTGHLLCIFGQRVPLSYLDCVTMRVHGPHWGCCWVLQH